MKELEEYRQRARAARDEKARIEEAQEKRRNLLRHRQDRLALVRRQDAGSAEERQLLLEIKALADEINQDIQTARTILAPSAPFTEDSARALPGKLPWELVEGLDDRLPFLLLPVRIETRFMAVEGRKELWVRIFPDDIAVHTHEKNLTPDELNAGKTYWREVWRSRQESGAAKKEAIKKGAWRSLAEAFGGARASWIASQTRPAALDVPSLEDLKFPEFPEETLKAESWSLAPRSKVMPDRFVVMGFSGGKEVFRKAGNPVPDPLIVGPDPQAAEAEFRQEGGELLVGEEIAWIYDFQKAVKVGMGLQIELEPPFDSQGFSQLIVLGLRLGVDEKESQAQVEELFENHSYAPDGLSFVPQGTPTNNTDAQGSGFSSVDPGAETSFTVATGGRLFDPVDITLEKTDAQRMVEALGIRHKLFQRIQHADRSDMRDALHMNRALWSETLGYYLEEMLDLKLQRIGQVRSFFTKNVTGRGLLPAVRVGSQPYGILLTSDFSRWKWSETMDGDDFRGLVDIQEAMQKVEKSLVGLIPNVTRIGAAGDPFQNLLNTIGLQASSVEFYRRHAAGLEYVWNYQAFTPGVFQGQKMVDILSKVAKSLASELETGTTNLASIFRLAFFTRQDQIRDPLVDDIALDEVEKLSETKRLRAVYQVPDPQNPAAGMATDYIGWVGFSPYSILKAQSFANMEGEGQPIPRPLLYRMLRSALLQAIHDATLRLYIGRDVLRLEARREVELSNIQVGRTVTRWEFMDAAINQVMPEVSGKSDRVAEFLLSEEGLKRPEAAGLRETLDSIRALVGLSTAQLERIFAEHIDLCSYRLDAWQTGCFNRRLQQQRFPPESEGKFEKRVQGLYLGAFGWIDDLRPGATPVTADLTGIPASLHDPQKDGSLFEQPDNAGFIHGPSLTHAVTAAVLRSAYLTHFDPAHPEKMAVNLSSERVRTALDFLEGVRNGQELGALLGYQFERGLHDRYDDPSLNQFIPKFRQKYPMTADKITQGPTGEQIETKEARNVFDGYALAEAVFVRQPPLAYPYGVAGLPAANSPQGLSIQSEVARMGDSLDAIADLSLAEGVYQVAQGNFERAGAMLKAMTQGDNPPDPEIVRTPRSGTVISQHVALHFTSGAVASPWPGAIGKRAALEPRLNAWLGDLLPHPSRIMYAVSLGEGQPDEQTLALAVLGLQPLDLVYLIGDDLVGETTELESRIIFHNRRKQKDDVLKVNIDFMADPANPSSVNLFELLPLLRAMRQIVTSCRALGAGDYSLPSEATSNPADDPNPQGFIISELRTRVQAALTAFSEAVNSLRTAIPALGTDGQPNFSLANTEKLRTALRALADFGVPDSFPRSAFGTSPQAKSTLVSQAVNTLAAATNSLASAQALKNTADDPLLIAQDRAAHYRSAAQAIFGPAFNLIPSFNLKNKAELQAAAGFRDASPPNNLTRYHQDNSLIVDEWLQGAARVQPNLNTLETIYILGENFGTPHNQQKPIQLPFRKEDHWVAVEYPDTFLPEGEYLSVLQDLPVTGFRPDLPQSGLLIDEWTEVIPSKAETTGIAFHFNQPNSEPPQTLLLAVTPEITGVWTWDKLVGILQNTYQRAQLRAVEPDQIGDTALAQLLPAIVTPVASHPFATIATDLIHQTAVNFPRNLV